MEGGLSLTLIKLPENVRFCSLSKDKILHLWNKLKHFDKLFTDDTVYDEVSFTANLASKNSVTLEVADNGIIVYNNIVEGTKARVHVSFWDYKLSARKELLRDCLIWGILQFDLHRIEIVIPEFSRALRRFAEKRMGFKFEGRIRKTMWYKGQLTDMILLSILREEVLTCQEQQQQES